MTFKEQQRNILGWYINLRVAAAGCSLTFDAERMDGSGTGGVRLISLSDLLVPYLYLFRLFHVVSWLSVMFSMEIVWHGKFNELFARFPHQWTLEPTNALVQQATIVNDSAKVRFLCKVTISHWLISRINFFCTAAVLAFPVFLGGTRWSVVQVQAITTFVSRIQVMSYIRCTHLERPIWTCRQCNIIDYIIETHFYNQL